MSEELFDGSLTPSPQLLKRKIEEVDDVLNLPPSKTQETYVKHPDHWALDGNVLLQIGNTRFSVHRSRLATHSLWFEALFAARSQLPFDPDYDGLQSALESVEVVNSHDLFYLDYTGSGVRAPNAEEFTALLTAMDNAMYVYHCPLDVIVIDRFYSEYVNNRPSFNVLKEILAAADFYRFDKFLKFATECIIALFPQTVQAITSTEIPNSFEAVSVAREYDIHEIWPASFYQLARLKPPINNDEFRNLTRADLVKLLDLQKRIVLFWNDILDIVAHDCKVPNCVMFHTEQVRLIKKKHPLDPIVGISRLIKRDWGTGDARSCGRPLEEFINKLRTARLKFWDEMTEMLDPDSERD